MDHAPPYAQRRDGCHRDNGGGMAPKADQWAVGARAAAVLKELEEQFATPIEKLKEVADAMTTEEMHAGLESEEGSMLKMFISFVDINFPQGTYHVSFLARLTKQKSISFDLRN